MGSKLLWCHHACLSYFLFLSFFLWSFYLIRTIFAALINNKFIKAHIIKCIYYGRRRLGWETRETNGSFFYNYCKAYHQQQLLRICKRAITCFWSLHVTTEEKKKWELYFEFRWKWYWRQITVPSWLQGACYHFIGW